LKGCLGLCRERCPVCPCIYIAKPAPACPPIQPCKDKDDYQKKPFPACPAATVCKDPDDYVKKPGKIHLNRCSEPWYTCGVLQPAATKVCKGK
jgi:hypothetical protein